jgi:hypothetical protein
MPAATMSDPNEFGRKQPHNLFSDRRAGGNSKNRAFFESSRTEPAQKPAKKAAAAGSQPPRGPKNPNGPKNPSEFKSPPTKGKY